MKKLTAIVLILIMAFANTELYQLLKTPKLISHYFKHKNNDLSVSLFDFLKLHYSGNCNNDNDQSDDSQLPFMSDECLNSASVFLPVLKFELRETGFVIVKSYSLYNLNFKPVQYSDKIFQPPKG